MHLSELQIGSRLFQQRPLVAPSMPRSTAYNYPLRRTDSHRSMRETIKVLTSTFSAAATPYPLPDEIHHTIEAFLERYRDIEEHDSQRFHEDLLSLYMRHVAGNREKHGPFLSALRLVRPALTGEARLNEWWGLVVKPTIETMGHKRHELQDARDFLQSILAFDAEEDKSGEQARLSQSFSKTILEAYLSRTKVPSSAEDSVSPEDEFVSRELETILIAFGRRKPKVCFLKSIASIFSLMSTGTSSCIG